MATTTIVYVDEKNQPIDFGAAVVNGIAQKRILRRVTAANVVRWWLWAVKGATVTQGMLAQAAQDMNVVPPASEGADTTPTPGAYVRVPATLPETGDLLAWDATQMRPYGLRRTLLKGDPGAPGADGVDGRDGRDGINGETPNLMMDGTVLSVYYSNPQNPTPLMNLESLAGAPGVDGNDGREGRPGKNGTDGTDGIDGKSAYDLAVESGFAGTLTDWLTSLRGERGETGGTGAQGIPGLPGKDGANSVVPGPQGPRGASLTSGVGDVITPGQDQDTYLNATTGTLAQFVSGAWHIIPGVTLKGPTGTQGIPGTPGLAATIDSVTATTGDTASVTNTGTPTNAKLAFTLPRGAAGTPGTPGAAATIRVGNVTTTNPGNNATVTNTGTDNAAVLDFAIPRGQEGPTGSAATIRVGQVFSGQSAAVTNSGTTSAATLDFTLPKGDKGDKGDTGATGAGYTQRGNWTSGTTYTVGDVVAYNGSSYAARQSTATVNTQNPAAAGITYWQVLAQKGDAGTNGTNGVNGTNGINGTSATITVNTVKTGATPNVVNVGTSSNALLDFTLPAASVVSFATVTASETTISNSYAPLTTTGPVANIVCGTQGIIVVTLSANASQNGRMSAKIEQGSTVVFAASDAFCLWSGGGPFQGSRTRTWTGLTPGATYTITALYNAPILGNATFAQREITVSTR